MLFLHTTEATHYITNDKKKKPYSKKYTVLLKVVSTYPMREWVSLLVSKKQEMGTCRISLYP